MGCDIHCHIEFEDRKDRWFHWSAPCILRDYELFAKMANVRNYDEISYIAPPRGLPKDITLPTAIDHQRDNYHDESWLSCEEVAYLVRWDRMDRNHNWYDPNSLEYQLGYFFGNDFWGRDSFPENIIDTRLVFWFDN
jgi:hypothetical protein